MTRQYTGLRVSRYRLWRVALNVHLYLVRHGQSHVNLGDITVSHRDEPLTDLGENKLHAREWIRENIRATDFYASSVARTAQNRPDHQVGGRAATETRW